MLEILEVRVTSGVVILDVVVVALLALLPFLSWRRIPKGTTLTQLVVRGSL
jgi:hypothetical protein